MTYAAYKQFFFESLKHNYPHEEIEALFFQVLKHFLGVSRLALGECLNDEIKNERKIKDVLERLRNNEPLQYIIGKAYFYNLELEVNSNVLIPRPETEELVQLVLDENGEQSLHVLDVGTGSGCIALALKKSKPNWLVTGIDSSAEALYVASANAAQLNLPIHLKLADMCSMKLYEKFDVIVANPPYIPIERAETLHANVRDFEPNAALFAPENDALHYYKCILSYATKHLPKASGKIYFETHFDQAEAVANLGKKYGAVRVINDMFGKGRFVAINFAK